MPEASSVLNETLVAYCCRPANSSVSRGRPKASPPGRLHASSAFPVAPQLSISIMPRRSCVCGRSAKPSHVWLHPDSDPIKHARHPVQLHRMCLRGVSPPMPQGSSQEAKIIQLVTPDSYGEFVDDLAEMHRLRYRVFKERLGWDVQVSGGMEIDEFDALHPAYLLQRGSDDRLPGCGRPLPSAGPHILRDTFPALLSRRPPPPSPEICESSRFALDAVPNSINASG